MKRILTLLVSTTLMLTAAAQSDGHDGRKENNSRRAAQMTRELMLSDNDAEWFKKNYTEYLDTLSGIARRYNPARGHRDKKQEDAKKTDNKTRKRDSKSAERQLTDDEAIQLVENIFHRTEDELVVKRQYYKLFKRRLTPQQLVKIFSRPAMNRQNSNNDRGPIPGGPHNGFPGGRGGYMGGGF